MISRINGGYRNGGYTLRLKPGENHLDGEQALALARTRKNECNPAENDLTRARRQQKILAAIKSRLLHPVTFLRLPFVSWQAPKAVRSDMAGPDLLGLFGAIATGGSPKTRVLKGEPEGNGLRVSDAVKQREVRAVPEGLGAARRMLQPFCLLGGVVFEAVVGDAEGWEPRIEEVGVAVAVLLEGSWRAVELAAVEFDDEVVVSVDGVDFVAGDLLVSLGEWEVVAFEEAGEVVFEVGAGGALLGRELDVRRPGYLVKRVVSSAAVTSRWTWASLTARVSCLGLRTSARSTSVRAGVVTRMP